MLKTSVPDVLPSGQYIKRCTAKDNADVTDHYQHIVASWSKDEIGLSLSKACGPMIKWYDQPS